MTRFSFLASVTVNLAIAALTEAGSRSFAFVANLLSAFTLDVMVLSL